MNFESTCKPHSLVAQQRRAAALTRLPQWPTLQESAAQAPAQSKPVFDHRGQLLPRERVALLLDPGAPFLPLCALAGFMQDTPDPAKSVSGGGKIAGIGFVEGVRCMVVASDSGIETETIQARGLEKILRVQELALQNKLPFVHLVESAGANLMHYKVEGFVPEGSLLRNLARLSAAGLPVLTVQNGSDTAGGACMPGLSDNVIMVRGSSRPFLAGPLLLKAATGEVAAEEELGGAEMHNSVSGLGEYLCEDDRHALGTARDVVARWDWAAHSTPHKDNNTFKSPRQDAEELLGLMPAHQREQIDRREVTLRVVNDSDFLELKRLFDAATVCAQARIGGHAVDLISNNGSIDVAGAHKATDFIQWMCQLGHPIVYLQNTTGYKVCKESEQGGMIKHGSKMIQAVTNATVPQITMQIVAEADMARKGITPGPEKMQAQFDKIVALFEAQADALYTSGLVLDDGVIDHHDTRSVLSFCLDTCLEATARQPRATTFGVARM